MSFLESLKFPHNFVGLTRDWIFIHTLNFPKFKLTAVINICIDHRDHLIKARKARLFRDGLTYTVKSPTDKTSVRRLLPGARSIPLGYRHQRSALLNCIVTPLCSLLVSALPYHGDLKLPRVEAEIENAFILVVQKLCL